MWRGTGAGHDDSSIAVQGIGEERGTIQAALSEIYSPHHEILRSLSDLSELHGRRDNANGENQRIRKG